jgi:hypothetical protein
MEQKENKQGMDISILVEAEIVKLDPANIPSEYVISGKKYSLPEDFLGEIISNKYRLQKERWYPNISLRRTFSNNPLKIGDKIQLDVKTELYKKR